YNSGHQDSAFLGPVSHSGGLVQWLQNVPCYHEVIGRRPRFGHHTGCETSKKPIYR
ncbi:unnamed protein product, partial [Rangifer tarandus platyrhynchus]